MNEPTLRFISEHADADVRQLALRGCKEPEVDLPLALQQIQGRQTARQKIPSWAAIDGIVYPVHLSMEQCSSEATARYKALVAGRLLQTKVAHGLDKCPGDTLLIDLTGGLGVDCAFMSEAFDKTLYVEQDRDLCAVAAANFRTLGKDVTTVCGDGTDYLHQTTHATLLYIDPARRDTHGGRTYDIADCTPNVLALRDELLRKADIVMLKLSPMLDWRKAVNDLGKKHVSEVHIVSVQNECKELLIVMQEECDETAVFCVNDQQVFRPDTVQGDVPSHIEIKEGSFLYEPNSSVMKSGCFKEVAIRYGVSPLAPNSHLFISSTPTEDFPGRRFQISAISSMNKSEIKAKIAHLHQANLTVRNFPLSVAELRKRLKISEGGSNYIFATTLADGRHVLLICLKAD